MSTSQNEIPLLELKLGNGQTVFMAEYLTTGQSRELQKILIGTGSFNPEEKKMDKVPMGTFLDMQDKAAEFLIKSIKNADGVEATFTKEWLYNLPVKDGNKVYEKINLITADSQLTEEGKKK